MMVAGTGCAEECCCVGKNRRRSDESRVQFEEMKRGGHCRGSEEAKGTKQETLWASFRKDTPKEPSKDQGFEV